MTLGDLWLLMGLAAAIWLIRRLYASIVDAVAGGNVLSAVGYSLVTSPGLLLAAATLGENRPLAAFTHLGVLPWAVAFGDTLVLPAVFGLAAYANGQPTAGTTRRWTPTVRRYRISLMVGCGLGLAFHLWDSSTNYVPHGMTALTVSLTKVIHDLIVFPVLAGAVICVSELVWRRRDLLTWAFAGLLLVWAVLVVVDSNRGLDPHNFHTACDAVCGAHNMSDHLHHLLRAAHIIK